MGFKPDSMMQTQSIKLNGIIYNSGNTDKLFIDSEPKSPWQSAISDFLQNWFDDTDSVPAQTSGSTGIPKNILLSKQCMINSARMTNQFFGLNSESIALLCLPASYIAGKMMLVRALVGGYDLICVEPKANPFEDIHSKIDFAAITPYQLNYSAETLKTKTVSNIIVGGGHVNTKQEEIAAKIPAAMYETYGMTETCSHIALRRFNGENKSEYFKILNGVSIRKDERECLVINAPHLSENEIITNDIVEIFNQNSFRWSGRFDMVINSGGIKIHPESVEKKLAGFIPAAFFISAQPDKILGEKVILVIESTEYTDIQKNELNEAFEKLLSKYEIPKKVYFVKQFVYSTSNKILRKETLSKIIG